MRTIMIFIMTFCVLDVNAQERRFENFKVVAEFVGYSLYDEYDYRRWIVPLDFEQLLDSLKLEYRNKSVLLNKNTLSDSLLWRLSKMPYLNFKENASRGIQEEWREAVPESLQKRLAEYGEKANADVYFKVQMLADCEGNVLAVYFELMKDCLDLVQEDELQAISDRVKAYGFNPDDFVFAQSNGEYIKQVIDSIRELQANKSLTDEERETWSKKLEKEVLTPSIPINYGVIVCFEMEFRPDLQKERKE